VVRFWVRPADLDDGNAPGVSTAESKRIYDLDQEIRRFKRANEILNGRQLLRAEFDRQQKK